MEGENARALLFALRNQEEMAVNASRNIERYDAFMEKWVTRNPDSSLAERYRRETAPREARVKSIREAIQFAVLGGIVGGILGLSWVNFGVLLAELSWRQPEGWYLLYHRRYLPLLALSIFKRQAA
ncbi:MAG: hypothetical protein H5U36_08810 [Candidatus Caldatribacterium sp.]|nr:hypothetical protein [Candidatus Caldatribacterium sp.]